MFQGSGRIIFASWLSLVCLAAHGAVFAQSDQGLAARQFGIGQPARIEDLPPGQLKRRLETLPPQASAQALKWLQDIEFTGADLDLLHADEEGGVHFVDTLLPDPALGDTAASSADGSGVPATALDDVFVLHSRPGAPNTVFLDFDGHVISGTAWNSGGVDAYLARPYDLDGDPLTFNDTERARIAEIWHRVAEDLASFDIDVTTEEPASFDRYTGRVLITRNQDEYGAAMPYANAGGVAYINVFGGNNYPYYSPALVYYNNLSGGAQSYVAEASSHEFGHNLGLSHDGTTSGATYYAGHGSGLVSWAPIMGNSYHNNVTQFSRGEYPGANQTQDDLAMIANKLGLVPDDHGDTPAAGTPLGVGADGSVLSSNPELDPHSVLPENKGVIDSATDVDVFTFVSGTGTVSLSVTPAWDAFYPGTSRRGANLDVEAQLLDATGSPIASSEPLTDTSAQLVVDVTAGTYHLRVTGVGNDVTPYSDYDSLGQYFISGSVPLETVDTVPPTPSPMNFAAVPAAISDTGIAMAASVAVDETSVVEYRFSCVSGGTGCVNSTWQTERTYTATGLVAGTQYTFTVTARDATGNQTDASSPVSATTDAPPPYVEYHATGEALVAGTVSGTSSAPGSDDGAAQSITEIESGGKPTQRYSYLEHRWSFSIASGSSANVLANAWSSGSVDGDTFDFAYSLDDGATWQPLFNVSETDVGNTKSAALTGGTGGTVWVRVTDTNRSSGNRARDSISIDWLVIQVSNDAGQPLEEPLDEPTGTLSLTANGYKVQGRHHVDLAWAGAELVDVWRDGGIVAAGVSGGSFTDAVGSKGGGSYQHRVCAGGGTTECSASVTTTF